MDNNRNKIDKFTLVMSIVAIFAITVIGSFLLKLENTETSIIMKSVDETSELDAMPEKQSSLVNINSASKEELMLLEGIGEKRAEDIIEYRSKKPFTKPEDIMHVSGIGEKIYQKFADEICVE